jgi:hypothetical protein
MSEGYTLLFNHTHTEISNEYGRRAIGEKTNENHYADYSKLLECLDDEFNAVIVNTEHYFSEEAYPHEFLEDINSMEEGYIEGEYESHISGNVGDTRFALVNGVEAGFLDQENHFIMIGLPYENDYGLVEPDREIFYESAEDAEIVHPAHPFFESEILDYNLGISDELINEFMEESEKGSWRAGVGYMTGYFHPFFNKMARGELPWQNKSVGDISEDYSTPLIPEQDWHVKLPRDLGGVGVIEEEDIYDFDSKQFDPGSLLGSEIIAPREGWFSVSGAIDIHQGLKHFDRFEPGEFRNFCDQRLESFRDISPEDIEPRIRSI